MKRCTYAIADLHGRLDLLIRAIRQIVRHALRHGIQSAVLVVLGDATDRGPESAAIIAWLLEATKDDGPVRIIYVKGNHDDMMVQCVRGKKRLDWWLGNGGFATIASYGGQGRDISVIPEEHIEFLDRRPLYYADEHRVFVHASIDPAMPLDGQSKQVLLWELQGRYNTGGYRNRFVVHGHEQFSDGPIRTNGRINLDTFAWRTGRLVVAVFDDDVPGGPVELIEIQGRPYDMVTGDYE